MDISAISFEVLREEGRIIGFELTAIAETHAESYCLSFPKAVGLQKADVRVEGTKIVFDHKGLTHKEAGVLSGSGGVFTHDVTPEEATALHDLLNGEGAYEGMTPNVSTLQGFKRGFRLVAKK